MVTLIIINLDVWIKCDEFLNYSCHKAEEVRPPSTIKSWPVIIDDDDDKRNAKHSATSEDSPMRPFGWILDGSDKKFWKRQ